MSSSSSLEAKIVVLGAQGVGKTSLVNRYCKGAFNPAQTTSTIGASFLTKRVVDADTDTTVRLQIWDTAGQERFRSISRLYYRGANACILCYSITDAQSFVDMGTWLAELRRNLPGDVVLHVVGTKADMVARDPARREVPFERCIAYVAENLAPGQGSTPPPTAVSPLPVSSAGFPLHPTDGTAAVTGLGLGLGPGSAQHQYHHNYNHNYANQYHNQHHQTAAAALTPFSSGPSFPIVGGAASASAATFIYSPIPPPPADHPAHPRSPSSKRSSGFWGQEAGWDACHEISAESGEGVEEVFRVVTRKLVEQNRKMRRALLTATATPGTPGYESGMDGGYFDGMGMGARGTSGGGGGGPSSGGSFRVGRDRRSWLFSPGFSPAIGAQIDRGGDGDGNGSGDDHGDGMGGSMGLRGKRCC